MCPETNPEAVLPPLFVARLQEVLSPAAYAAALARIGNGSGWCTFRVNTLKGAAEPVVAQLREQGFTPVAWPLLPEAWAVPVEQREAMVYCPEVRDGDIYIQNYASMLPPRMLQVEPGMEVLDLAAAPGGKTLHLAALMANQGRIAAVEVVRNRYYRLRDNIERAGASVVQTYCKDGTRVGRQVPERFDRVLLDAPCSSESRFRLNRPESWAFWSEKKIAEMQRKQKQLLYSAVLALKPGGRLIYSTCSFAPEENEVVVAHILKKFSGQLAVEPVTWPTANTAAGLEIQGGLPAWRGRTFPAEVRDGLRILPSDTTDGFFVCAFRKAGVSI